MAISKQYLQLFDVKPWSHHHQKATIEWTPTADCAQPALPHAAPRLARPARPANKQACCPSVCQTNEKNCPMTSLAHPFLLLSIIK